MHEKITKLIDLHDERSQKAAANGSLLKYYQERALNHLLKIHQENLPRLDWYFHKCFRQASPLGCGNSEMAIWCLLQNAEIFWECFREVNRRKRKVKPIKS